jgi:gentisate 1,2-dioxygenase
MALSSEFVREQEQLTAKSNQLHLVQFWREKDDIEHLKPRPRPQPFLWRWADMLPHLQWAGKAVGVEDAERRGLLFANPGLGGKYYATQTLLGAYSLYNPGETAAVHRHTASASRFVIAGDGGFTTVNGEKCVMARGDLIINPAGLWHDHGNEGTEPVIWMDVLDIPYTESLNCAYFEFDYFEEVAGTNSRERIRKSTQTIRFPDGYSEKIFALGGIVPLFGDEDRARGNHSAKYHYKWETTREALLRLKTEKGTPYDGVMVEYCDPRTGKSVMPNMSFRAQLLRAGERTLPYRDTTSAIYCVLEGEGTTRVGDITLDWQENDVFVIPNWMWREHINKPGKDAVLYSVSDSPIITRGGLFRQQAKTPAGEILDLVAF